MGDPLKNPPLVEAVCEFRFAPDSEWDWTVPGRLFDKIGDEFSERSEVHRLGIRVEEVDKDGQPPTVFEAGPDRIQFKRPDGSAMVQVGPRLLAVNHLRPYEKWEAFRDLILRAYRTHRDIAGSGPLARIGLRYINKIDRRDLPIEQILTVSPRLSGRLDRSVATFYQRYELHHNDPKGMLIHQTGLQIADGKSAVMLDLDFVSEAVSDIRDSDATMSWLDRAHARVEESFIDSVAPDLYQQLKLGERS